MPRESEHDKDLWCRNVFLWPMLVWKSGDLWAPKQFIFVTDSIDLCWILLWSYETILSPGVSSRVLYYLFWTNLVYGFCFPSVSNSTRNAFFFLLFFFFSFPSQIFKTFISSFVVMCSARERWHSRMSEEFVILSSAALDWEQGKTIASFHP